MNSEIIQCQKPQRSRFCGLKTRALAWLVLAAATLCLAGGIARATDPNSQPAVNIVHVDVSGLHNDTGQVVCALFASPNGFPHDFDKALMRTTVAISNQHASCEFHDVKPATYAITVVHDENSNGKLDRNVIGIPKEGVGISGSQKPHFGIPRYERAEFNFPGGRLELPIKIAYLL
jgi:uncharacterized protein (DUF2141 family)